MKPELQKLGIDGVDGIIIGPVDLSISLGNTGNIMHEKQLKAIQKVVDLCVQYNKTFGIIGTNEILDYFKDNVNYFISANDTNLIKNGLKLASMEYDKMMR